MGKNDQNNKRGPGHGSAHASLCKGDWDVSWKNFEYCIRSAWAYMTALLIKYGNSGVEAAFF